MTAPGKITQLDWLRLEIQTLRADRDMWRERATSRASTADVEKGQDQTLTLRLAVSKWLLAEAADPRTQLALLCEKAYRSLCDAAGLK